MDGWKTEHKLVLGVAKVYDPDCYGDGSPVTLCFTEGREFRDHLRAMPLSSEKIWVFAHNIGFDMRIVGLMRGLSDGHFSLVPPAGMPNAGRYRDPLFVADGHPVMIRLFRDDGQQFLFVDTFNWFPVKLAKVGDWLGMPKGEDPGGREPTSDRWEYCGQDVEILDRALRRLWGWMQSMRITHFAMTPASQCRHLYKIRFERKRIVIPEDESRVKLDRLGYFGGTTEVYRHGRYEKQCYHIDVNGLYPHVMKGNKYPCEVIECQHDPHIYTEPDAIDPSCTTAEVYLVSPERAYPVRGIDGTYGVRGKVRTVLTGPELRDAIDRGDVSRVGRYTVYKMEDLFSTYVNMLWRMRTQASGAGDGLVAAVCKYLLNSLHGKLGQRDGEWRHVGRTETPGYYGGGRVQFPGQTADVDARVIDGHMFHRCRDGEHSGSFVPIAAWCSAYARRYMSEYIDMINPSNVLYQVIDALIVTQDGYDALHEAECIDTGRLGDFKTVDSYKWVDIWANNQMETDHTSVHSGVKSGSDAVADGVWRVEEWQGLADSLRQGHVCSVGMRTVLRESSRDYFRRCVLADGHTVPWEIDNWSLSPEVQQRSSVRGENPGREQVERV